MLDDTCIVPTKERRRLPCTPPKWINSWRSMRSHLQQAQADRQVASSAWATALGRRRLGDGGSSLGDSTKSWATLGPGAWATALERALVDHAWATALGRGRVQLTQEERALVDHGLISRLLDVLGDGPLGTELGLCNAALAILNLGQRFEDAGPAGLNCPIGRASLRLSKLRRIVARRALLAMDCPVTV